MTFFFCITDDLLMKNPDPVAGEIAILDVRELTAAYLLKAFPHMKNAILLLRKAYAVRLKRLHVIVAPSSGIEKLLALLRPVLHPKVRENVRDSALYYCFYTNCFNCNNCKKNIIICYE